MAEESHIRIVEQRAADAEENRIQTERFLDMVSIPQLSFDATFRND